jgi:hypothetical protein
MFLLDCFAQAHESLFKILKPLLPANILIVFHFQYFLNCKSTHYFINPRRNSAHKIAVATATLRDSEPTLPDG